MINFDAHEELADQGRVKPKIDLETWYTGIIFDPFLVNKKCDDDDDDRRFVILSIRHKPTESGI